MKIVISFLSVFFCLTIFFLDASGQPFKDRILLDVEFGFDIEKPASLSFAIQPKIQVHSNFTIGVKYDRAGIRSFGDWYYKEAGLHNLSSVGMNVTGHFAFLKARFFIGYGPVYYMKSAREIEILIVGTNTVIVRKIPKEHKLGKNLMFGIEGKNFYVAMVDNDIKLEERNEIDGYKSIRLGLKLIQSKSFPYAPVENKILPLFMFELGTEGQIPINNGGQAAAFAYYIEPKIAILPNFSLGFRYYMDQQPLGFDNDRFSRYYYSLPWNSNNPNSKELRFSSLNRMSHISPMLGKAAYYHKVLSGWWVIDFGAGMYDKEGVDGIAGLDENNQERIIPEIPGEKNFGISIGADYKTGMFRTGFDFNFTGKNIPNYFSIQIAFEPGFGGKWRKVRT